MRIEPKKKICVGCGVPRFIYKQDGKDRYCKLCWDLKKYEEAKQTKNAGKDRFKKQRRIKKRSLKKQREDVIYGRKKAEYLKLHPQCEANIPGVCSNQPADQIHHKKGKVGQLYLDERYFMATEFNCHRWIEDHPAEAIKLGFSEKRLTKTVKDMEQKKIIITETLSEFLKEQPELKQDAICDIDTAIDTYTKTAKEHGGTVTAHSFNLHIQKDVDSALLETEKSGQKISCSKGCSACCRTIEVIISEHEAQLLVMRAKEINLPIDVHRLNTQAASKDYKDVPPADQACVFLSDVGVCSIYSHRPSACRKYHVTSHPANCDNILHPKASVSKVIVFKAEIAASAVMNAAPNGRMAQMLLQVLNKEV